MMPPLSSRVVAEQKPAHKKKSNKKRKHSDDSENEDELKSFKKRPKAAVNRPMIQPPVNKVPKQRIKLSLAQLDPNASFEECVAQFDRLEAIAKKRKSRR